jgi:hypothetical protein
VLGFGVVGRVWVSGGWVAQALHCNMLSCVWVGMLALDRERVRCRIFGLMMREVGSLMGLGVVVPWV